MTADQLARLVRAMATDMAIGPEFVASLPRGGDDGTLAHRFRHPYFAARVRAKTGSMAGVSSLAGLAQSATGGRYAFAIMVEGWPGGDLGAARRLQERVVDLLLAIDASG